jgi:feruloyl esterase
MRTISLLLVAAIVFVILFALPTSAATSCENLASLKLQDTTITLAQTMAAGSFVPPAAPGGRGFPGQAADAFKDLPAFCRVAATLRPSSDSDIKIEVWMPASGWNGKFEAEGNGGWAGVVSIPQMASAVRRGYATASSDTGHVGPTGSFALGHPEKLADFGYRAVHEMTVKAKAIIAAYYDGAPKLSYWNGCSSGGREGLKEAQKFPADFDGIIAGAPANYWTHLVTQSIWVGQAVHQEEASFIPQSKYKLIHDAAIQACDARDGVKDGVIENPARCKFDPAVLQCKAGDAATCLTSAQVEAARKIYAPAANPRTKEIIFPGLMPGSEMAWAGLAGPQPLSIATDHFKYVVFNDPNWDYKKLNFDTDVALADKVDNSTINAIDPNLKAFFGRGGKILQYHGWNDQLISPLNSVNYYKSVQDAMGGASKLKDNYRLFMVPGMNHCAGGDGPSNFSPLKALEDWVEKGIAPEKIIASHMTDGKPDRTRPLCPYPQAAVYKGSGSTDEAANFACK